MVNEDNSVLITLIRRELLDNLMTFRFAAAVFITLLLVVANTMVLIKDYERRLASYNTAVKRNYEQLQESKTYSVGDIYVNRPPNPLSIFNVGLDKRLGNELGISYTHVPTLWDATMSGSDNPFLNIFSSIHIVFIFEVVLSLIALIFAYDAIARERERGTLRLMLTHPLRRGYILLAKYIGAMLCLFIPLLLSLLLSLILLTNSAAFPLGMPDFLRIGGIVVSSFAYLSVFYLIGLLISAVTLRTSTALMLSMFVWGFLVLVYPNMIVAIIKSPEHRQTREESTFNQIKQLWEEFDRERKLFLANDPVPGEDFRFNIASLSGFDFEFVGKDASTLRYYYQVGVQIESFEKESEPEILHAQNYFRFLGPRTIDAAERTWLVRKPTLEDVFVQPANLERTLLKLSPVGLYDAATQAWAGTDLLGVRDFFIIARRHRQAVIDYFADNKTFGARQWFSADKGAVDWSTLPQFSFQRSPVQVNAMRASRNLCLLLITNLVLFMTIFLIFQKREV